MTRGDLIALGCALVALSVPWLGYWLYWLGRGEGERRALAARPPCPHPPCPLAGGAARVEIVAPPPPDAGRTREVTPDMIEAARAQADEERRRASGSWAAPKPSEPRWPVDAKTLPDLTKVPDDLKGKAKR